MTITTRFRPGDTVYRQYNNHILAHTVDAVNIQAVEDIIVITYTLTRNTHTQYPSGGNIPIIGEQQLYKDPE